MTRASQLAALIAYYGFVSLFPLLLVFVTVLGFVLEGNPGERRKACSTARSASSRSSATSSGTALAERQPGRPGDRPRRRAARRPRASRRHPEGLQPDLVRAAQAPARLPHARGCAAWHCCSPCWARSASSRRSPPASSARPATPARRGRSAGIVIAFAVNLILFLTAFRLLTGDRAALRELLPGVIVGERLLAAPPALGGYYVDHVAQAHADPCTASSPSSSGCSPGCTWAPR